MCTHSVLINFTGSIISRIRNRKILFLHIVKTYGFAQVHSQVIRLYFQQSSTSNVSAGTCQNRSSVFDPTVRPQLNAADQLVPRCTHSTVSRCYRQSGIPKNRIRIRLQVLQLNMKTVLC